MLPKYGPVHSSVRSHFNVHITVFEPDYTGVLQVRSLPGFLFSNSQVFLAWEGLHVPCICPDC